MVVLVIFGFVFYTSISVTKIKAEKRAEKTIAEIIQGTTFKYYITTCLDSALEEGLKTIGEQGGFLHNHQSNIINWEIPYIEYEYNKKKINVSYQIYSSTSGKIKEKVERIDSPEFYPCYSNCNEVYTDASLINRACDSANPVCYKGMTAEKCRDMVGESCYKTYGHSKKDFRDSFGATTDPEVKIRPDLCKEKITKPGYKCTCGTGNPEEIPCKYSIQAQLEDFIETKTKSCVDLSDFSDYDISIGDVKAHLTFGNEDVSVVVDFPVTIRSGDSPPVINMLNFYSTQPVRFKTIYDVIFRRDPGKEGILENDIKDVSFDIERDSKEIINKNGGYMKVKRIELDATNTTIVMLTDEKSKLNGRDYVFMFARENRHPALDYMRSGLINDDYDFYYILGEDTINLNPKAYDPDEDFLLYEYSTISLSKPQDNIIANALQESGEFSLEGKGEEYLGTRIINVKAKDLYPYSDWQDVRILIDDKPDVILTSDNLFRDENGDMAFNPWEASVEDPFFIDFTGTEESNDIGGTVSVHITDSHDSSCATGWIAEDEYYIPSKPEDADIKTIPEECFSSVGQHTLTIQARDDIYKTTIGVDSFVVDVKKCFHYRRTGTNGKIIPSYPFNNLPFEDGYENEPNPFLADHTCCANYNTFSTSPETSPCYELVDYGCQSDLDPDYNLEGLPAYTATFFESLGYTPTDRTMNSDHESGDFYRREVYMRTIKVGCGGERGNVCQGDYTYNLEYTGTVCEQATAGSGEGLCCKHALTLEEACAPCDEI